MAGRARGMEQRQMEMKRDRRALAAAGALLLALSTGQTALAQKQGGILRVPFFDSPALPGGTAADPPPFSAPTADPPGGRW
jgi:hypothetical protein